MGYLKDFNVNITRLTTAVRQKGFGTILIMSHEQDIEVTRFVDIAGVADVFETDTATYKMASDLFAQRVDEIMIAGTTTDAGGDLVSELNSIISEDDSFFGVVSTLQDETTLEALGDWVGTQDKIYATTTNNLQASSTSDQVLLAYHEDDNLAEKALAFMLVKEIGGTDLDGKQVPNIKNSNITPTEYATLKENNVNVALEKFGNLVIDGGDMAGGEKVDIMLSEFWIKIRMEEDLAGLKVNNAKIPYTDAGVALLIDVANTRLKMAAMRGIVALDADGIPEYEVTYLPVAEVPMADRANRRYDYIKWTARLAGAIRKGNISGVLTV